MKSTTLRIGYALALAVRRVRRRRRARSISTRPMRPSSRPSSRAWGPLSPRRSSRTGRPNGNFATPEALMRVKGIGARIVEINKANILVARSGTARALTAVAHVRTGAGPAPHPSSRGSRESAAAPQQRCVRYHFRTNYRGDVDATYSNSRVSRCRPRHALPTGDESVAERDAADRRQAVDSVRGGRGARCRRRAPGVRHRLVETRDRGPLRHRCRARAAAAESGKHDLLGARSRHRPARGDLHLRAARACRSASATPCCARKAPSATSRSSCTSPTTSSTARSAASSRCASTSRSTGRASSASRPCRAIRPAATASWPCRTRRAARSASRGSSRNRGPKDAPSNLAVVGRYILTPAIFGKLEQHAARRRRRDPADGRHRELARRRARARAAVRRHPLRLRQQDRLSARDGRVRSAPPGARRELPRVPAERLGTVAARHHVAAAPRISSLCSPRRGG